MRFEQRLLETSFPIRGLVLLAGFLMGLLASASGAAAFTVLPNYSASTQCTGYYEPDPQFCTYTYPESPSENFSTTATAEPDFRRATAQAQITEKGDLPGGSVSALAGLGYSVMVVPPPNAKPNEQLALDFFATAVASGQQASAVLVVNGATLATVCAGSSCPANVSGSFKNKESIILATVNVPISVAVAAYATATTTREIRSATSKAGIDPYIEIDPSTPDASLYTLIFSPGIANSPLSGMAVPEPATWLLALLGFAIAGEIARAKRGKAKNASGSRCPAF